jgi:hypothetical protein
MTGTSRLSQNRKLAKQIREFAVVLWYRPILAFAVRRGGFYSFIDLSLLVMRGTFFSRRDSITQMRE